MLKVTSIPYVIFACCVLHNFIIRNSGIDEDDMDVDDTADQPDAMGGTPADQAAIDKRMDIAHLLF